MQLHVTKRSYCYFFVWTVSGTKCIKVLRDDTFWENNMLFKIRRFYMEAYLYEIIDCRLARKLDIREPNYHEEAMKAKRRKSWQAKESTKT